MPVVTIKASCIFANLEFLGGFYQILINKLLHLGSYDTKQCLLKRVARKIKNKISNGNVLKKCILMSQWQKNAEGTEFSI